MRNLENAPRIYVGTYGRYNDGSLFGKWFELLDYDTLKDFQQDIASSSTGMSLTAAAAARN